MQPILKINLTTGTTEEYVIPKEWERDFLGGASLAARILYPYLTKELDPLSPESPLLFINGPLTGTSGPTTGRFVICGKSPATQLWAESNIGGFWGPELRKAGYDGLWVTGKSNSPVYLWVEEGRLEVRNAASVWGKDVYQTQELIKEDVGVKGARVAVIGQAGERGVLYSSICCDHGRMAGRTGLGAIMGSKNLKAIAVYGKKKIEVADEERYFALRSEANRTLKQDNQARIVHELGSASAANFAEYLGQMPAKYYHQGSFANVDNISGSKMSESILALYEMGKLTKQDTGGIELTWGNFMAVRQLIHMIARREGLGELFSRGSRQFGAAFGAEDEAVQVNGLEVAYHDPRGVSGMALAYATSPRGACHNQSDYFMVDWGNTQENIGITYFDRHAQAEKAANVARHQNWRTFFNSFRDVHLCQC
ncbi:MAG: hypothetical protein IPJ46_02865 [Anaerolineales bacterium]|nr:hypothetical protein [Anaerolineales bacterium]